MNRATVRRFVRAESFPERASRRVPRRTDQVSDFLQRRWNEECRNAARLFDELKAEGFDGSYHMVRRRLAPWRRRAASEGTCGKAQTPSNKRVSPRRIVWLLLKPQSELDDAERALRARLEEDSGLRSAAELGRPFREMVRTRQEEPGTIGLTNRNKRPRLENYEALPKAYRQIKQLCGKRCGLPGAMGKSKDM